MDKIRIAKLWEDAKLPTRKHPTDAGLDLYAYIEDYDEGYGDGVKVGIMFPPGDVDIIHTGIVVEVPRGYVGLIWPKSRSNYLIGGGVVDSGYQGEILVKIINTTGKDLYIEHGDAVAQLLIVPVEIPGIEICPLYEIQGEETERGQTGGITKQTSTIQGTILDLFPNCDFTVEPHEGYCEEIKFGNDNKKYKGFGI